jgi:hypothetical protein
MGGQILFISDIQELSILGLWPVNMNILNLEIGVLRMGPKIQNGNYHEYRSNDGGTRECIWLRHYATSRRVAG